jgi:hypothetical protein
MLKKVRIVQLKNLELTNLTDDEILALSKAQVIAWIGAGDKGFYWKYGIEGPIGHGDNPDEYRVKIQIQAPSNLEPDGPIVVIDKPYKW